MISEGKAADEMCGQGKINLDWIEKLYAKQAK